eukprot:TRINITY_DN59297_c0_g1_i1.p1 TRINITY_DN59297_c0_g1~~TRINITY_DN59297_c0_g1_i1.p1  ORF type:complete len:322 (+),score=32.65 TRINITY_DN59297_c0_g1_i1:174-1139(+)
MCIRDRYQRRVHGNSIMDIQHMNELGRIISPSFYAFRRCFFTSKNPDLGECFAPIYLQRFRKLAPTVSRAHSRPSPHIQRLKIKSPPGTVAPAVVHFDSRIKMLRGTSKNKANKTSFGSTYKCSRRSLQTEFDNDADIFSKTLNTSRTLSKESTRERTRINGMFKKIFKSPKKNTTLCQSLKDTPQNLFSEKLNSSPEPIRRAGHESQRATEREFWKKRGHEYPISKALTPIRRYKIVNVQHLLANPEAGTLDFFVKYLRHTLISNIDPFMKEKFRTFSKKVGEESIGKNFLVRMAHDIQGRKAQKEAVSFQESSRGTSNN